MTNRHTAATATGNIEKIQITPRFMRQLSDFLTPVRLTLAVIFCTMLAAPAQAAVLRGAGATFPAPLYTRWATQYLEATTVEVRYEAVGSGAGIQRIESGLVDFGASDIPLSTAQLTSEGLMQFPAVVGGVVPVINIDGIGSGTLRLSGAVLADIYLGRIRKWNAPEIAALNPELHLPRANITVVHRADASGTTFLWSSFLALANKDWTAPAAATIDWPLGIAAVGNEGVASMVQRTRTSIAYVEYAYARAHHLRVIALRNRDGEFVLPGASSFRAAMDTATRSGAGLDALLIDQAGAGSWPITAASFVLLKTSEQTAEHNRDVLKFFDWALTHGQKAAEDLDYIPLPDAAVRKVRQSWPPALRSGP